MKTSEWRHRDIELELQLSSYIPQKRFRGKSTPKASNKNMEENPAPPVEKYLVFHRHVPSICQNFFGPSKKVFNKNIPPHPGCISGLMLFTASFGALLGGYISDALTKCLEAKKDFETSPLLMKKTHFDIFKKIHDVIFGKKSGIMTPRTVAFDVLFRCRLSRFHGRPFTAQLSVGISVPTTLLYYHYVPHSPVPRPRDADWLVTVPG